tara:strand:- start:1120 stop:1803 length:684 start_codon:yes stop_codon:yes gene_type:complete
MKEVIISPPFSNILPNTKHYTRIIGTYTLKRRRGLWRVFTTLRKVKNGWFNNVGLRNPGISKVPNKEVIVSIAELNPGDFEKILDVLSKKDKVLGVEFNISCPNADVRKLNKYILRKAKSLFSVVIVKVPHEYDGFDELIDMGVEYIHVSNSYMGISGKMLYLKNLLKVKDLRVKHEGLKIIGGGGVYSVVDFYQYKLAGASHVSLSTLFLHPIKLIKFILKLRSLR